MPSFSPIADRYRDKVAVVTGAASGIGAAIARRFVAEGGRVAGGDINEAALDAMSAELGDGFVAVAATSPTKPRWPHSSPPR